MAEVLLPPFWLLTAVFHQPVCLVPNLLFQPFWLPPTWLPKPVWSMKMPLAMAGAAEAAITVAVSAVMMSLRIILVLSILVRPLRPLVDGDCFRRVIRNDA